MRSACRLCSCVLYYNAVIRMNYPIRKLPRLKEYDYTTPGAYFVTICSHEKQCVFGRITPGDHGDDARMLYSPIGKLAKACLLEIESHFQSIIIDNWIIMPNHIHMILRVGREAERIYAFPIANISTAVGTFKAAVTRAARNACLHSGKLWQSSFYDHIIRNDEDYQAIWNYISGNPSKWLEDRFYCE